MKLEQDIETRMTRRNMTNTQKKNQTSLMEGVVVNNFIKDVTLDETYDTLVISKQTQMPEKLYEVETKKERGLLPLCAASLGIMGALFLGTKFISYISKPDSEKLPGITRNHCINDELHQSMFSMLHSPNKKTIQAFSGVIALSSMVFLGKMFIDGCKEIWVKKREADIQKNLQENLVKVEAQCFSGKIQIIRSLLSQKARQFSLDLGGNADKEVSSKGNVNFKSDNNGDKRNNGLNYWMAALGTVVSIAGLGYFAMKNLRKNAQNIKSGVDKTKSMIESTVNFINEGKSKTENKEELNYLEKLLETIWAEPEYIKRVVAKLNLPEEEKLRLTKQFIESVTSPIEQANSVMGGSGRNKITYYSHVNDYLSFFYDWLMNSDNKQFRNLFIGISSISALSYTGKNVFEAVKEVQVKKYNADIELNLQRRLVATELRNFKAKKDAAIDPLCNEFYRQKVNGKSNEELKVMADNILFEIKNGPPFVYS